MWRGLVVCSVAAVIASPAVARADDDAKARADALVVQGNELARKRQFDDATAAFKQAHAIYPRALYLCNLGIAYSELGRWHQANYFLTSCFERWQETEDRAIDERVTRLINESLHRLRDGAYARIRIDADPVDATVTAPGAYADDEPLMHGRTYWMPRGERELVAVRPGHVTRRVTATVDGDRIVDVRIELAREPAPAADPPPRPAPLVPPASPAPVTRDREPERGRLPWIVLGVGGASAVAAVSLHVIAVGTKRDAESLPAGSAFDDRNATYDLQRGVAIGLYAVSAAAAGTGLYLMWRRSRDRPPRAGVDVSPGSASVWLGGSF